MRRVAVTVAIGLCVVALVVIISGGSGGYTVRAVFNDANGIRANYWVKVNGAVAGTVTDVSVTPGGRALLTMTLDRGVIPIGAGASAAIRPTDLLGEDYIQLSRGDLSRPLPSGTTIPLQRTSTAVSLDQVLNMLAPTTRAKLRILINEAGIGLSGRGADLGALLQQLPGSLGGARGVLDQLAAENARLGQLIDQADLVVAPLNQRRTDVAALITQANTALAAVADRRASLAATVRSAAPSLVQITSTLDRLAAAAQRLTPAAGLLNRTAPYLASMLRALPAVATNLRSPLATATQVAPQLTQLGRGATPDVRQLTPTVGLLSTVLAQAQPLVNTLGRGGGVDGVMGILGNWAKASAYQDGISHYFDFHVSISQQVLSDAVQRFMSAASSKHGTAHPVAGTGTTLGGILGHLLKPQAPAGAVHTGTTRRSAPPARPVPVVSSLSGTLGAVSTGLGSLLKYLVAK
ncbi:MAG: MlaD family protein [Solirubrobacteraceae bacterium]